MLGQRDSPLSTEESNQAGEFILEETCVGIDGRFASFHNDGCCSSSEMAHK